MNPISIYWLVASGVCFLLEALGIPGVGFLFAGLSAIFVAALVHLDLVSDNDYIMQFGIFAVLSSISALVLWKKLKTWRVDPSGPQYSNIIGTEAITVEALIGGKTGTLRWSGTLMTGKLADPSMPSILAGETVKIVSMEGNTLFVVPIPKVDHTNVNHTTDF